MKILSIALLLLYSNIANTQVYKCIGSNGSTRYSDAKCESGSGEIVDARKPNAPVKHAENHTFPLSSNGNSKLASIIRYKGANHYFYHIIFSAYLLMSIICYFAYRRDKKYARTQQWRTPESTLHMYELFGGWPGGLIAQHTLRHKNSKLSYQISFWFIVTLHLVGWFDYLVLNLSLLRRIIFFVAQAG